MPQLRDRIAGQVRRHAVGVEDGAGVLSWMKIASLA
jgi:hypothetical protein